MSGSIKPRAVMDPERIEYIGTYAGSIRPAVRKKSGVDPGSKISGLYSFGAYGYSSLSGGLHLFPSAQHVPSYAVSALDLNALDEAGGYGHFSHG